ncbi:reverse transcriptase domain-containing protein [Tanacetum coccineum]
MDRTIAIGFTLTEDGRKEMCGLLRRNLDIFALKPADMTRVPRHIAEHRLNIREGCLPVRQMKIGQAHERNKAIYEEVEKLVDAEAEMAFKQMKKLIAELPMLTAPKEKEELIMYLAATKEAISLVLMTERDGKQMPIYFVSRVLQGSEINYTPIEKLILASTENVSQGTNSSGFHYGASERQLHEYTHEGQRRTSGSLDIIQRRLIMRRRFWIVAIDYFTKWIEEKPVETITGAQIKKFVWENIVCRFGLPEEIISDNGNQFRDNPFKDWCEKLCIRQCFASVKHPQANGLVERENRSLGEGIKARLDERSKNWLEEISHVLWALEINLDLLEERREEAAIQEAKSKSKMEKYYNARVRNTSFRPGDLVYQNNEASHAEDGGKLEPKWEGPYEVTEALGKGAYKLRDRNGNTLPRT